MAEFIKIPKQYIDGKLLNYVPNGCEFPDELKYTPEDNTVTAHKKAMAAEICWLRQNMVRYTDLQSPSEFAANHPAWDLYVSTAGNDTTGRGTVAEPFASPHRAIAYLDRYIIPNGQTATINVQNGTYNFTETLQLRHASDAYIILLGESVGGVTFNFTGVGGIVNSGLRVENIIANGTGVGLGFYSIDGQSFITNCQANNFNIGFHSAGNYVAYFGNNSASGNVGSGFQVGGSGGIDAQAGAILTADSNDYGFYVVGGSSASIPNAVATNNTLYGMLARRNSTIYQAGSTVTGNGTDYSPAVGFEHADGSRIN